MCPKHWNPFHEKLEVDYLLLRVSNRLTVSSWSVVLQSSTFDTFNLGILDLVEHFLCMLSRIELNESKVELLKEWSKHRRKVRVNFSFH